jgi:hypothetical protein
MHGHDDPEGQDLLWGELNAVLNAVLDEELDAFVPAQRLSLENTRE